MNVLKNQQQKTQKKAAATTVAAGLEKRQRGDRSTACVPGVVSLSILPSKWSERTRARVCIFCLLSGGGCVKDRLMIGRQIERDFPEHTVLRDREREIDMACQIFISR